MKNKYVLVIAGVCLWGFINGFVIPKPETASVAVGLWMSIFGVSFFLIHAGVNRRSPWSSLKKLQAKSWLVLALLGVCAGANNAFFYYALELNQGYDAVVVHYLAPIILVLWLRPLLGERVGVVHVLALALGFWGMTMLGDVSIIYEKDWFIFAFISAIFYSLEMVFSKRVGSLNIAGYISALIKMVFQIIVFLPVGIFILHQRMSVVSGEWWEMVGAGLVLYISFLFVFNGLKRVEDKYGVSSKAFGALSYLDRIVAVVLLALFSGKVITNNFIVGGSMIAGAQGIILWSERKG